MSAVHRESVLATVSSAIQYRIYCIIFTWPCRISTIDSWHFFMLFYCIFNEWFAQLVAYLIFIQSATDFQRQLTSPHVVIEYWILMCIFLGEHRTLEEWQIWTMLNYVASHTKFTHSTCIKIGFIIHLWCNEIQNTEKKWAMSAIPWAIAIWTEDNENEYTS